MPVVSPESLNLSGSNAPQRRCSLNDEFVPELGEGASSYRWELPELGNLDALLIHRGSDTLVVSLHGAIDRSRNEIPRFERLRTLNSFNVTSMFFGDPSLWLDERLLLAWYTGNADVDVHEIIAEIIISTARALKISRIIISGSSGGGFAALQISARIPNSLALAFNAQTDISQYRINGISYGAQRTYASVVFPEIVNNFQEPSDIENPGWIKPHRLRMSAVERYSSDTPNWIFLVQNEEEFHMEEHFEPFVKSVTNRGIDFRLKTHLYRGGIVHNPPTQEVFIECLEEAISFIRTAL